MISDFVQLDPLLLAQLGKGQLSHAYILQGQEALEQSLALAALLNCQNPDGSRPCEKCPVCLNILAGTYPDCRIIEPDRGSHRIEGMKAMGAQAQLAPIGEGWKVYILPQAEKMSDEAANNLLKLLEEPPPNTIFILLCDQPDQLLPTVISRCQIFVLGNDFGKKVRQADPQMIEEAKEFINGLPAMHIYEVLIRARDREKREDQRDFLLALLTVLHSGAIGQLSLPMAYPYLLRSATMVESSLELIDNNVNQKMLMDVVYLRLWQNIER